MKKRFLTYCCIAGMALGITGCSDFFNPDMGNTMYEEDYMQVYTELYAGYMGVAATVQEVADKSIYLEGLRGDLFEPTYNAPQEFWDVYNYKADLQGNSLASPEGYYKVILHANDFLKHAFEYRVEYPNGIDETIFNGLVGGTLRYKAWAYLMLAKIYGEAIYLDDPLGKYEDIKKYPLWDFDLIINKCIDLVENGMNGVDGKAEVRWSKELFPGQSETTAMLEWNRLCPPADMILAELYLWKRNYAKVHQHCVTLLHTGANDGTCYMINLSEYNGEWVNLSRRFTRKEHVCMVFYDYIQQQTNNVIRYLSDTDPNLYYLRPTQASIDRWNNQPRQGGVGDTYRGEGRGFKTSNNGNIVFWKYASARSSVDDVYMSDIPVGLYRATDIYLFMAEALVGLGRFTEALVFLNGGIDEYFDNTNGVFKEPFTEYPTQMFSSRGDRSMAGIRGRVALSALGREVLSSPNIDIDVDKRMIDSLLVEESFVEAAGESRSYYAMIRMSRKWGADMQANWAKTVAAKYPDGTGIEALLAADPKNWFIKYDLYKED